MGNWTADDLNKIAGTYLPGKCGFHIVAAKRKVFLRCPYRFVQRKTNLSPSEKSFGHRIFTRLAQRDLPQKKSFGLMQFIGGHIFSLHLVKVMLN
jgi:hypothetical protein